MFELTYTTDMSYSERRAVMERNAELRLSEWKDSQPKRPTPSLLMRTLVGNLKIVVKV
jgi:hypothetical protein